MDYFIGRQRKENNILTLLLFSVAFLVTIFGYSVYAYEPDPLPSQFKVYRSTAGKIVLVPTEGYDEKIIPSINLYTKEPGCYIACYSTNPDKAVYPVGKFFLVGQIRVSGVYVQKSCVPTYYEDTNLRTDPDFKTLCSRTFQCIGNSCWANGNTGDWFGLK